MAKLTTKEYQAKLEAGVKDLCESGEFKAFLEFSQGFRDYSLCNTLLIWTQRHNASFVAGYKAWQKKGRQVKKGSKAIRILAPMIRHSKTEDDEDKTFVSGFRAVNVFDISQTDGPDVPEIHHGDIKATTANPQDLLARLVDTAPVPVEITSIKGEARGQYWPHEKKITVKEGLTAVEQCKTLLHEIGHHYALTVHEDKDSRGVGEVIAEGIAYLTGSALGIDSGEYSFPYIATWGGGYKALLKAADRIREYADEILDNVNAKAAA